MSKMNSPSSQSPSTATRHLYTTLTPPPNVSQQYPYSPQGNTVVTPQQQQYTQNQQRVIRQAPQEYVPSQFVPGQQYPPRSNAIVQSYPPLQANIPQQVQVPQRNPSLSYTTPSQQTQIHQRNVPLSYAVPGQQAIHQPNASQQQQIYSALQQYPIPLPNAVPQHHQATQQPIGSIQQSRPPQSPVIQQNILQHGHPRSPVIQQTVLQHGPTQSPVIQQTVPHHASSESHVAQRNVSQQSIPRFQHAQRQSVSHQPSNHVPTSVPQSMPQQIVAPQNGPQPTVTAPGTVAQVIQNPTVSVPSGGNTTTNPTATPSGPPVYNYKFYDAGNNQLSCDNHPNLPTFSIQTTRGFMDIVKRTVVICTLQGQDKAKTDRSTVQGVVDWKNKKVIVGHVSKMFTEAKRKIGGTFSLDAEWTWPSGKYTITRNSGVWTAKRGNQDIATYTGLKVNAFSKNELATLRFHVEMPHEERVFLIIALMFHDYQMPPVAEPKTFKERAGEAGVHIATTVATNALTACCVVQ